MADNRSQHIIHTLKKHWVFSVLAGYLLFSSAISILLVAVLHFFYNISIVWVGIFIPCIFGVFLTVNRSWRVKDEDVIRFLDSEYPGLEESSALLLKTPGTLNGLQQLQLEKNEQLLGTISGPRRWYRRSVTGIVLVVVAVLLSYGFSGLKFRKGNVSGISETSLKDHSYEGVPVKLSSLEIGIQPPAYTGLKARIQNGPEIRAEENAVITWTMITSGPVQRVYILMNDANLIPLDRTNAEGSEWTARYALITGGYYQIMIDTLKSPIYPMEMIKDQLPEIVVHQPGSETVIEYGTPANTGVRLTVSDDYGVQHSEILATVSSGSGEAVKFQQHRISFSESFKSGLKSYTLNRSIDLSKLAMKPGDELYFYIRAVDSRKQEKRSDVFVVKLEDTAQLFSVEGLLTGVNIKPEYFRSQRQIIIETEQLIRDQAAVSEKEFIDKSSSLGIDQKLLRLRYGKFLGEEAVTYESPVQEGEIHKDEEEDHDHQQENPNEPRDVLSQFGHSHDNAEDATFFDPETKKQLRATLNEMWKAELQLRLAKPREALPFEYKALRLLKDLQQKSRVYVAKTSPKANLLNNEKRLTGELDKIVEPVKNYTMTFRPSDTEPLTKSLTILSSLKNTSNFNPADISTLRDASVSLGEKAVESPAQFIPALEALRSLISALEQSQPVLYRDIALSERAILALIKVPSAKPAVRSTPSGILSEQYFRNLQQIQRR